MTKDGRIYIFEIMQYDEYWKPEKALKWLNRIGCDYIAVCHDKDKNEDGTPKGKHYHIEVRMRSCRTINDIAKNCDLKSQYIEIKDSYYNAVAYAFHKTKQARADGKYEYDASAIIGNKHTTFEEVEQRSIEYDNGINHDKEIKELLYKYGNCEATKNDVLDKMTAVDYDKHGNLYKKMKEYRIMKVKDRDMTVVYITGVSGSGKTTLAKYMARVKNYDFFISGSGKDVLDGYDKEECIILDDLRASVFEKAELFKLTDNNTNSSVKSRYANKDISYCKLMIITSIKTPQDLYNWNTDSQENKDETFAQFARRIRNGFIYIDESYNIYDCKYDVMDYNKRTTKTLCDFNMTQVFMLLGIEKQIGTDLMDGIFKKINDDIKQNNIKKDDLPF